MNKKYKFVLTLPGNVEVDSAEEIEGHVSWPNYSQADPVFYKGIFDSYDEAKEYGTKFSVYKYVLNNEGYDSYYCYEDYFISIFDAEDAVCAYLGISPGEPYCEHPDSYTVEETEYEGNGVYKYCLHYYGECVYDSLDEDEYYDTYEEAEQAAKRAKETFDIELGGLDEYYSLEEIEIVDVRVEEISGNDQ